VIGTSEAFSSLPPRYWRAAPFPTLVANKWGCRTHAAAPFSSGKGSMSEEKEIYCEDDAGNHLSGTYAVLAGVLTVTARDGRKRRTQLGSMSPETVAKFMLRDLAKTRRT
jgi:hypothetical protein